MPDTHKKTNGKHYGVKPVDRPADAEGNWRDVTGKFKLVFDQMEKDQEENTEKVRRQTDAIKRHANDSVAKRAKR